MSEHYSSVDEIRAEVEHIRGLMNDDEAAHGREDDLWAGVLAAIAAGVLSGEAAQECARVALTTQEMDFARWCA